MDEGAVAISVLGTRWGQTPHGKWKSRGFLGLRQEWIELPPLQFVDWTVNGESVRDWFDSPGFERSEITWMIEGARGDAMAKESLEALLPGSESLPRSDFRFGDGRVAILYCAGCGDLACGALSADVRFTDSTVEWRDLTYQDAIADELWTDMPRRDITFERSAYEGIVRGLLAEWGGGPGTTSVRR